MRNRLILPLSLLPPILALALQRLFWDTLQPYAWFLFYPAVFVSAWLGGFAGGALSTLFSVALVNWFFLEPTHSLVVANYPDLIRTALFAVMGLLFSYVHHRLRLVRTRLSAARTEAEQTLAKTAESEAMLRTIYEQAPLGIGLIESLTGRILDVNPRYCEILGRSRDELIEIDWMAITYPDDVQEDLDQMARLNADEIDGFQINKRLLRGDGRAFWVSLTVARVTNEPGESRRHLALIEDISERLQTENALAEAREIAIRHASEQRYAAVISQRIAGVVESNVNFRILFVNDRYCEILGYTREELLGRQIGEFTLDQDWQGNRLMLENLLTRGGSAVMEKRYRRKDGSVIWVNVSVELLRDEAGQPLSFVALVLEITPLKLANERLLLALNAAQLGTYDWDISTNRIVWSPQHEKLWGFQTGEFDGTFEAFASGVHPDDLPGILAEIAHCEETRDRFSADFRVIWPDGSEHWITSVGNFVYGDSGQPLLMYGTVQDFTDRKRLENATRSSEAMHKVALYARSLIEASLDPLVTINPKGKITDVNAATETATGCSREELIGSDFSDYFTEPEMARAGYQQVFTNGSVTDYPLAIRHVSGHITDVLYNASVYRNDAGEVEGVFAAARDITDRKKAELALTRYAEIVKSSEAAIIGKTLEGIVSSWNYGAERLFGYRGDEILHQSITTIIPDEYRIEERGILEKIRNGQPVEHYETVRKRKDGQLLDVSVTVSPVRDTTGHIVGASTIARDITEEKRMANRLRLAASVFTYAREGIFITDASGTIIDVNDTFTRITGYSQEEVIGQNPRMLQSGRHTREFYAAMWQAITVKGQWYGEVWNRRKNGEVFAELLTISAVRDEKSAIRNYVALFSDITPMKTHQQELEHLAHYDALTVLPNRLLLSDRLQQAMAQAERRGNSLALVYLDLDGFKAINDQHGHAVGDELLIAVSQRMETSLRDGDTLARLGGDEFVAVLVDLDRPQDCEPVLNRLLQASADPVKLDDLVLQVSASLGVTLYPQDDADADQLLRHADQAMYLAKQAGKNRYHIFDVAQDMAVKTQLASLERIRVAFQRHEFKMYYQPKVNLRTGQVIGAEALIRWQHPESGLLRPAAFLPLVENHPFGIELGEWVLDTAFAQLSQWHAQGFNLPISVNISAQELQQADFVPRLRDRLTAYPNIPPDHLELEILESSALEDIVKVSRVMQAVKEIGLRFAIDDFGTGYSSLTYLKRLPADVIKIDQSFVRDMLDDPEDLAIVEGVIGLATAFGRQAIAEGVETASHGQLLLPLGCEWAQGYGIAQPMLAEELPDWARRWRAPDIWQSAAAGADGQMLLPALLAITQHRAWIREVEVCLAGETLAHPPPDERHCRFGRWLEGEGTKRWSTHRLFQQALAIHHRVHSLADELLALHAQNQQAVARSRLGELHSLRDELIETLQGIIAEPRVEGTGIKGVH